MIDLNNLNECGSKVPEKGDILVIQTKKKPEEKILAEVKNVVNDNEVILMMYSNSFYNHDMYYAGESWVKRVWNLGKITLTTSVNNFNKFTDY